VEEVDHVGRPGYMKKPQRGMLVGLDCGGSLTFSSNPETVNKKDGFKLAENLAPGAPDSVRQFSGGAPRIIAFELVVTCSNGGSPSAAEQTLEAFTQPCGDDPFRGPPRVMLTLGSRTWEGFVEKVEVEEQLFDINLNPIHITARVSFKRDDVL